MTEAIVSDPWWSGFIWGTATGLLAMLVVMLIVR